MTRTVKVATAQLAPVFLDREATVEKVCDAIREAGGNGARLIAFPETFIPGYPYWAKLLDPVSSAPFNRTLFEQAVEIPSPATTRLCTAAREAGVHAVIGLNERDGGTLYNTQLFIDAEGHILGKRHKLVPTAHERMIWGMGDGADIGVFDMPFARVGGLICAEHSNALYRYALQAQGEQIHIANWPGGQPHLTGVMDAAIRNYAWEAQAFVINATALLTPEIIAALGEGGNLHTLQPGGGFAAIVGPWGDYLAGPEQDRECILYADLDFTAITDAKMLIDSAGHYARPDVVRLQLVQRPENRRPLIYRDDDQDESRGPEATP